MLGRVEMTVVQLNGSSINVCNEVRAGLFVKCSHTFWGCSPQTEMFFYVKTEFWHDILCLTVVSVFIDQFSDSNHGSTIAEIIVIHRTNG